MAKETSEGWDLPLLGYLPFVLIYCQVIVLHGLTMFLQSRETIPQQKMLQEDFASVQ